MKCAIDSKTRTPGYDGRYAEIGKVARGQTVAMTFPISERIEKRTIEKYNYTFVLRGNDVVQVDPPGKYCPYYQRGHYRAETPLYAKVTRFTSPHDLSWV